MIESGTARAQFRIFRGTPGGTQEEVEYEVPLAPGITVLDAVHWVQRNIDTDLACRWNCKAARCGSCSAEINGRPALLCKTRIDTLPPGPITIRPLKSFPLVKDLVTDVAGNFETNRKIVGFTSVPDDGEPWRVLPDDIERLYEFRSCIECFLCQDVCHVIRDHGRADDFFGPRYFVRTAALEMHPRDTLDRTEQTVEEGGLDYCNVTRCCTDVCPEHIRITDNAIIPLKERDVDRRWDPFRRLGRRLRAGMSKSAHRSRPR